METPPSDCTTMVLTPHTEGNTIGWIADLSRVNKNLVPIETQHGTQLAVGISVATVFSALIDNHSKHKMYHEHQWPSWTSPDHALTPNNDLGSYSDFLNDWDKFYTEFIQSMTYALVHSNKANLSSSSIADNYDDDWLMSESNATKMPNLLHQLCLVLRELEKVNWSQNTILPCSLSATLPTLCQQPAATTNVPPILRVSHSASFCTYCLQPQILLQSFGSNHYHP